MFRSHVSPSFRYPRGQLLELSNTYPRQGTFPALRPKESTQDCPWNTAFGASRDQLHHRDGLDTDSELVSLVFRLAVPVLYTSPTYETQAGFLSPPVIYVIFAPSLSIQPVETMTRRFVLPLVFQNGFVCVNSGARRYFAPCIGFLIHPSIDRKNLLIHLNDNFANNASPHRTKAPLPCTGAAHRRPAHRTRATNHRRFDALAPA